jgi:hypothetical protein
MAMCTDRARATDQDITTCTEKLLPLLACEKKNLDYFKGKKQLSDDMD